MMLKHRWTSSYIYSQSF
uniref:Uncharacterized protein n=1 Tax=Arundo donax TaxID=35708 RepID=A0A0A9HM72_ARUDO